MFETTKTIKQDRMHALARLAQRDPVVAARKLSPRQRALLLSLADGDESAIDRFGSVLSDRTLGSLERAGFCHGLRLTEIGVAVAKAAKPAPWIVEPHGTSRWALFAPGQNADRDEPASRFLDDRLARRVAEMLTERDLEAAKRER